MSRQYNRMHSHVSTQSDACLASSGCTPQDRMLRYDEVALPCACSTTSVSRSSSATACRLDKVARSGRRTARVVVVRIIILALRIPGDCTWVCTSCKTCCIGALAVWHRLWRCILSLSMSEADKPCGRSRTTCTSRACEMDRRLPRPKETVPPTRIAAGSPRGMCVCVCSYAAASSATPLSQRCYSYMSP